MKMQGPLFKIQEKGAIEGTNIENFFHSSTVYLYLCISL